MKNPTWKIACVAAALAAWLLPATAQTTDNTTSAPTSKTINQRKENQQDRIGQGIQSGQLTAGEASKLETKESDLNKEERLMRSEDNGKLTSTDKKALEQQQNQLSNQIYKDKHNQATQ